MSGKREDARMFQQGQHSLIPVLLRESVLDSVTFRATVKHFDDQVETVDTWLNTFIKHTRDFLTQFCKLEEQALSFYGKATPTFVESGIVDSDYTVTAMSRCNDANKAYWTSIFTNARSVEQTTTEPLLRLQNNELKEIRHLRNEFYKQQKAYDEMLRYYYQQPKSKEASSLREDAFQLYEKRKGYFKSSFDYTIKLSTFRAALDAALIASLSNSFEGTLNHTSALATDFASRPSMSRIMSWAHEMSKSSRDAEEYLLTVRFEMEDEMNRLASPARDLAEYASATRKSPVKTASSQTTKQGWLMMRCITGKPARYVWHRKWFYVRDGIFGWLSNNPKTGAVEESDKIGVLLCNVKIPVVEDRRFTFEVLTKDSTILLQAESDLEVAEWIQVFDIVKKAVLSSQHSNEHAFAVTKPRAEFAAAPQTLDPGHGEPHSTENSPVLPSSKKFHAANEQGVGSTLGVLVSVSGVTSNLATPRMGNLFSKLEDQKFFNPFENNVEGSTLAPYTFAPAPVNTSLTRESLLDQSTSVVHGPSATQANHWGSVNYGMLNMTNKESFLGTGSTKLLTGPEAAIDNVYRQRDKEMMEKGLYNQPKTYPADYPMALRRQDAQFCSIFPHARTEHVLMVIRATRAIAGQKAMFSGRLFVTLKGLYYYAQSFGMTLVQSCAFSELLSVRMTRRVNYDELSFDIHDIGESGAILFLDDADLARKRIELLLANYIADEPKKPMEMLSILQKTLPDDTRMVRRTSVTNKSRTNDDSSNEEDDAQTIRKDSKVLAVKLKLPSEPVLTEPDVQMMEKSYDAEYMITAKGLFHLLFGNRSPVWLLAYQALGIPNVQQGPWQAVEDGTLARAHSYMVKQIDKFGNASTSSQFDYQRINKREEHLDYTVTLFRKPWSLARGSTYFINMKINISFVSKTKSRLRIWIDIDWKEPNYFLRGIISRTVLDEWQGSVDQITHFIEREVLDRLGIQSKTSKAVRMYGRVGGHSEPMSLESSDRNQVYLARTRQTVIELIIQYPMIFAQSVMSELWHFALQLISLMQKFVTANGLLLVLLVFSICANTWLASMDRFEARTHKAATKVLSKIDASPVGIMYRGVTLDQIDAIAFNGTEDGTMQGKCFESFKHVQDRGSYYQSFRGSRDSIARSRNDLMVAMKVLNGMEVEIVKGQWQEYLDTEKRNCMVLQDLDANDPALVSRELRDHCESCYSI